MMTAKWVRLGLFGAAMAVAAACERPVPPPDASAEATAGEAGDDVTGDATAEGHKVGGTYIPNANGATLPINLAGGAGVVTGVLPTGNQANQTLSTTGDSVCSGTTASASCTVGALSGSSPIVITPATLQWVAGAAPQIAQASTASTPGANMEICHPQQSTNTNATGGDCLVTLQAPSGSGTPANFVVRVGGTTYWSIGELNGNSSYSAMYPTGVGATTASNYALASTSTSVLLNAPNGAGSIGFNVANGGVGAWTTSAFNVFSGGVIYIPWQGAKASQAETITHVPFVLSTADKSAHTVYSFSLAFDQSAYVDMVAIGRVTAGGGTPWDVVGTERTQHINGDVYNNSGSVTAAQSSIYGSTGIAVVNSTGTTVNLTVAAAPAGAAPQVDFEGRITVILN